MLKLLKLLNSTSELQIKFEACFFSNTSRQLFFQDFSILMDEGVSTRQVVSTLSETYQGISQKVARSIQQALSEGKGVADGMVGWFPTHIVELIRVGEQGGIFLTSLKAAAESLEQKESVISTMISAITYPLVVLIAAMVVSVFIKQSIFSVYLTIKPLQQWPASGRQFYYFSNFIQHFAWLFPIVILSVIVGLINMLNNYIGEWRKHIDVIPFLAIYRKLNAALFMEMLGFLIVNGMMLKQALKIIYHSSSPYLASHVIMMEHRLGSGKDNMADVIDTGLIDHSDILRLRVIAKGKGFSKALVRQGKYAIARSNQQLKQFAKVLGFMILVGGGLLAAFMILSMYDVGAFISSY